MVEAGMCSTRIDILGKTQLIDSAQTLIITMLHQIINNSIRNLNQPINWVIQYFSIVAHLVCLLFSTKITKNIKKAAPSLKQSSYMKSFLYRFVQVGTTQSYPN